MLSGLWVKGAVYLHLFFKVLEALVTGGQINSVLEQLGYALGSFIDEILIK